MIKFLVGLSISYSLYVVIYLFAGLLKSAESAQSLSDSDSSVVIAVTVPIILTLVAILAILSGCYWYQRRKSDDGMKNVLVESERKKGACLIMANSTNNGTYLQWS